MINLINELINMFFAGFVFVTLYNWLTSIKMELYVVGIWSLLINAFIKSFFSAIHSVCFTSVDFDENLKVIVYVVFAIVCSFLSAKAYNSLLAKRILSSVGKKTVGNNIFKDVIDFDKRTMMVIYLKDSENFYGGIFKLLDENGSDSYVALTNYCIYNRNDNQIVKDYSKNKMSIVFNLQDVEHLEILYEDDSDVWAWLDSDNKDKNENMHSQSCGESSEIEDSE